MYLKNISWTICWTVTIDLSSELLWVNLYLLHQVPTPKKILIKSWKENIQSGLPCILLWAIIILRIKLHLFQTFKNLKMDVMYPYWSKKFCQLQHLHIIKKRNKKKIHTVHVNLNLTDQYGMKIQTVKYSNFVLHGKLTDFMAFKLL